MFTGIVEGTGTVVQLHGGRASSRRLTVESGLDVGSMELGSSVAVDGVCLTVVERTPSRFSADLGPETMARTTLGELEVGRRVHLERPLRLGEPLGGHLVAGHVDGVGTVVSRSQRGDALELWIQGPADLARYLARKGSIAVDGVSLTINQVQGTRFEVTLIPHTLAVTRLGERKVGSRVNLEADLIAKHVDRAVESRLPATRRRGKGKGKGTTSPLLVGASARRGRLRRSTRSA